jgi:hypothetical protein
MIPQELEKKIAEIFPSELCGACPSEGDNLKGCCENCSNIPHGKKPLKDLELNKLRNEDLHHLLAWEFWKDGADWDDFVEDIATGQYLPFNTREATIDQLRKVFGYS